MKVKYHKKLYVSPKCEKNIFKIKMRIRLRKLFPKYTIIVISKGTDQLEYFETMLLKQPHFKKESFFIVGIAEDKGSAQKLVEQMVHDSVISGYQGNIKEFLLKTNSN